MATFSAMFIANEVLPIEGRAAMMIKSDFWKPLVISSRSTKWVSRPGDALAALQERVNRAERLTDDLLHAHEAASNALFRELEDLRFGVVQDFFRGVDWLGRPRDGGRRV